ncbi:MAG: hypothetical protein QOC93_3006 [Actinomycetota bacterium]|jgi:hypothetical protein|nr:hypothetical protein [Cryptosporangiaceae bacterium]MDQ1677862.1 hypothetical protein [Actinomycetota bacterium]
MRLSWKDGLATVLVALAAGVYLCGVRVRTRPVSQAPALRPA